MFLYKGHTHALVVKKGPQAFPPLRRGARTVFRPPADELDAWPLASCRAALRRLEESPPCAVEEPAPEEDGPALKVELPNTWPAPSGGAPKVVVAGAKLVVELNEVGTDDDVAEMAVVGNPAPKLGCGVPNAVVVVDG